MTAGDACSALDAFPHSLREILWLPGDAAVRRSLSPSLSRGSAPQAWRSYGEGRTRLRPSTLLRGPHLAASACYAAGIRRSVYFELDRQRGGLDDAATNSV